MLTSFRSEIQWLLLKGWLNPVLTCRAQIDKRSARKPVRASSGPRSSQPCTAAMCLSTGVLARLIRMER